MFEVMYFLPKGLDLDPTKKVTLSVSFVMLACCNMSKVCISVDVLTCLLSNSKMKQAIPKNRSLYSYCYREWNFKIKVLTESKISLLIVKLAVLLFCVHVTSSYRRKMTKFLGGSS